MSDWTMVLNRVADAWAGWMLHMSWQVAVLVVVVWLLCRVLHYTAGQFRHLLWLVIFLKLVLPPTLATPWSAGTLYSRATDLQVSVKLVEHMPPNTDSSALTPTQPATATSPMESRIAPAQSELQQPEETTTASSIVTSLTVSAWIMLGWAMITATLLIAVGIQYTRFVRTLLKRAALASSALQDAVAKLAADLAIRKPVTVMLSPAVHTPAVFGVRRPVIVLPEDCESAFTAAELSNILAHEMGHIKRGDLFITGLAGLLTCLYWFHPAVWIANLYQRREREMACDDLVLEKNRDAGKAYAATLLRVAEHFTGRVPAFAGFLGLLELSDSLLHRVLAATDAKRPRRFGWASVVVLLTMIAFAPMGVWTASAQNDTAITPQENPAEKEIQQYYAKAHPEVREYIRWTAGNFGRSGLWLPETAFDALTPEQREEKIVYYVEALNGEYGRHQCEALASAGVLKDKRLLPGVLKAATYHRDDSDYDCRPKWIAVEAAGRLGDESAVPALIPLVDHGNQNVRMWARASLVRLTGQNFNDDKQAWGTWWNDSGKEPKIDLSQLKPWVPPVAASATTATPPIVGQAVVASETQAIVDSLPGDLTAKATYHHRSRGGDFPAPGTFWLKTTADQFIAISYMPSMNATYVAYIGKTGTMQRYDIFNHGRDGDPPTAQRMTITMDGVSVAHDGGEKNGQTETFTAPAGTLFQPNTRPDPYVAHMLLAFQGLPMKDVELACYDWDNTGKGMASYNTKVEYKGKESVTVPAGTFEAQHYVETQTSFGDTWFKKRPGHVTEYWVLDNGLMVRVLRHREPYELLLAGVETPTELPGRTSIGMQPASPPAAPVSDGVPNGTVRGVIRNEGTGEPIAGAFVAIDHSGDSGGSNLERFTNEGLYVTAETDDNGAFVLKNVAIRADHPFYVSAPGFVRQSQAVTLTADKPEQQVDVLLQPGAALVAEVKGEDGAPLDGVTLRLSAADGHDFLPLKADWPGFPYRTELSVNGSFKFGELAAGRYRVEALLVSDGVVSYLGASDVEVAAGEAKTVEIPHAQIESSVALTIAADPYRGEMSPGFFFGPAWDVPLQLGTFMGPESNVFGQIIANALVLDPNVYIGCCEPESNWPKETPSPNRDRMKPRLDTTKPVELRGFAAGKYTAFMVTAGKYPNIGAGGIYPRWVTFDIREHEKNVVQIPWNDPKGTMLEPPQTRKELSAAPQATPSERPETATSPASNSAPEVVFVTPAIGARDVDPATTEIRVTFDQDMAGGFSWTGGGDVYPKTTGAPSWIDKRTCVLPVTLEPGKFYRVGINSKSHRNFSGANGIPTRPRAIYFATQGADESTLAQLNAPQAITLSPENGATAVPSTTATLTATFNVPMGGGFSWTKAGGVTPEMTGKPEWNADRTVCTVAVSLKPKTTYTLGLNSTWAVNFQSAAGVPLDPVVWTFTTAD